MGLFVMSARELDRLKIIEDIIARRLSVVQGAELEKQENDFEGCLSITFNIVRALS